MVFLTIELLRRQLVFLAIELLDNWSFAKLVSRPDVQKLLTFCPSFPFPVFHQFAIPLEKLVHVPYIVSLGSIEA